MQDLDQAQVGEVAVERCRRPPAILEDRVHRELHGDAARFTHALSHALDRLEVNAVAGIDVAARLHDADDRFAREQLLGGEAVVHEALEIERHHVDVLRIVEPIA